MSEKRERFPFVARDAAAVPASLAPMLPLRLRLGGREESVSGLIDTGAAVNVLLRPKFKFGGGGRAVVGGIPIILLSGMAADERLFVSQVAAFPNIRVQPWVRPLPGESLRAYAARLAPLVDPGRPCIVGGASFGGVVAMEMAAHLPALACILVGSIRSPAGLPLRWRLMRPIASLGPDTLRVLAGLGWRLGRPVLSAGTARRLRRLSGPDAAFVRWAMCAVVRWRPSPAARRVRVFHIHGTADQVLPVALAGADVVVRGGGHALSLFSPSAVNEFVAGVVRAVQTPPRELLRKTASVSE